jgi:hypothetical protein
MRLVGIILVILGALALGYGGFSYVTSEEVADGGTAEVVVEKRKTVWIPPTVGGIALVSGLIVLVTSSGGERD